MALNILYTPFWQTDRLDVISLMHSIYIVFLALVVKNTSFRGCLFTKKALRTKMFWLTRLFDELLYFLHRGNRWFCWFIRFCYAGWWTWFCSAGWFCI